MIKFNKITHEGGASTDLKVKFESDEHDTKAIVSIPCSDFFTEDNCEFEGESNADNEYFFSPSEVNQLVEHAMKYAEDKGLIS